MGTIEQAAKRLEQLRRAGVEVEPVVQDRSAPVDSATDPLPQRVARELEARAAEGLAADSRASGFAGAAAAAGSVAPHAVSAAKPVSAEVQSGPVRGIGRVSTIEIDLARLSANGYITPHAPRSRLAEEFRVIKRPLLNNARSKAGATAVDARRIMVTSALPSEGKTYVSINLAMSIAMELDTPVLLVDADATRPAVLERLGLGPTKGLLDLLVDPKLPLESVVLPTNVDRLSILPAGNPQEQATELLASESMSRLIDRLGGVDPRTIVLFDTPPLLAASESRVLAAHMGQVLLVIAADDTPQGIVAEALATVENCPVVLSLLNRVSTGDRGHYYGSYGAHAH